MAMHPPSRSQHPWLRWLVWLFSRNGLPFFMGIALIHLLDFIEDLLADPVREFLAGRYSPAGLTAGLAMLGCGLLTLLLGLASGRRPVKRSAFVAFSFSLFAAVAVYSLRPKAIVSGPWQAAVTGVAGLATGLSFAVLRRLPGLVALLWPIGVWLLALTCILLVFPVWIKPNDSQLPVEARVVPPTVTRSSLTPLSRPTSTSSVPPTSLATLTATKASVGTEAPMGKCDGLPLPRGRPSAEQSALHTVQEGETIVAIANRYGKSPQEVIAVNAPFLPSLLHPGGVTADGEIWTGKDCIFPGWVLIIPEMAPELLPSPAPVGMISASAQALSRASTVLMAGRAPTADGPLGALIVVMLGLLLLPMLALAVALAVLRQR